MNQQRTREEQAIEYFVTAAAESLANAIWRARKLGTEEEQHQQFQAQIFREHRLAATLRHDATYAAAFRAASPPLRVTGSERDDANL